MKKYVLSTGTLRLQVVQAEISQATSNYDAAVEEHGRWIATMKLARRVLQRVRLSQSAQEAQIRELEGRLEVTNKTWTGNQSV